MPYNVDEVMTIANKYSIPVLEDAAEALGSSYKGRCCGTFGEFACLSFNGNKIITTSGGGALVSKSKDQAKEAKSLATQAREEEPYYQHKKIGYNYRLSNICAGIGRGQMTILEEHIKTRRAINKQYREQLKDVNGISFLSEPSTDYFSNHWLTCILIEKTLTGFSNEDLRIKMEQENIETRPLWKPMHLQPVFKNAPAYLDENHGHQGLSGYLFDRGLCLPSHPGLTDEDIVRVVAVIKGMLQ
jgi:dTDP-4-amino-4,6-dideoxygalactose transaminase